MLVMVVFSLFGMLGALLLPMVAAGELSRAEALLIVELVAAVAAIFMAICWILAGRQGELEHQLLASLFFLLAALALCASLRGFRR